MTHEVDRYASFPAATRYPDGHTQTYRDIYLMIRESPVTSPLFDKTRWLGFKPEGATEDEFQHRVGKDTNNGEHMRHQYGISRACTQYNEHPPAFWKGEIPKEALLTPMEKDVKAIAVTGHDLGELKVGDTAQPLKTKKSERKEFKALFRIANELTRSEDGTFGKAFRFFEPYLSWAPDSVYYAFFKGAYVLTRGDRELFGKMFQAFYNTLVQSESKIAKQFNCEEKIGYHITGLQVWKKSKKLEEYDPYRDSFRGMAFSVHTHNVAHLVEYSKIYPAAFVHLVANAETISDVYTTDPREAATTLQRYQGKVKATASPNAAQDERIRKEIDTLEAKFIAQREAWGEWKAKHEQEISEWKDEHSVSRAGSK